MLTFGVDQTYQQLWSSEIYQTTIWLYILSFCMKFPSPQCCRSRNYSCSKLDSKSTALPFDPFFLHISHRIKLRRCFLVRWRAGLMTLSSSASSFFECVKKCPRRIESLHYGSAIAFSCHGCWILSFLSARRFLVWLLQHRVCWACIHPLHARQDIGLLLGLLGGHLQYDPLSCPCWLETSAACRFETHGWFW